MNIFKLFPKRKNCTVKKIFILFQKYQFTTNCSNFNILYIFLLSWPFSTRHLIFYRGFHRGSCPGRIGSWISIILVIGKSSEEVALMTKLGEAIPPGHGTFNGISYDLRAFSRCPVYPVVRSKTNVLPNWR